VSSFPRSFLPSGVEDYDPLFNGFFFFFSVRWVGVISEWCRLAFNGDSLRSRSVRLGGIVVLFSSWHLFFSVDGDHPSLDLVLFVQDGLLRGVLAV